MKFYKNNHIMLYCGITIIIITVFSIIWILLNKNSTPQITQNYTIQPVTQQNNRIPKIVHLIWIGKKQRPNTLTSWTINFVKSYPNWKVKIWDDNDIEKLNLVNIKYYNKIPEMCGKADIARYEILYRYGGMYIDADTIWLGKNLNNNLFTGLLNMSYEKKNLIMNGWFSVVKLHPFFKFVIDEIPYRNLNDPPWISVGPTLITDVYKKYKKDSFGINFVPIELVLCPTDWHGIKNDKYKYILNKCEKSDALAFHWGFSTNNNVITNSS
jgi:mannosyltransferase OCH1-like enzyme